MSVIQQASYEQDLANNFVRAHRKSGTDVFSVRQHAHHMAVFMVSSGAGQFDPIVFMNAVCRTLMSPSC